MRHSLKNKLKISLLLVCFATTVSIADAAVLVLPGSEEAAQRKSATKAKQTKVEVTRREAQPKVEPKPEVVQEQPVQVEAQPEITAPRPDDVYFNKEVVKMSIAGNNRINAQDIAKIPGAKVGTTLTREQAADDLQAIYSTGWFYAVKPEFKLVPEGVQVTYVVQENPLYKDVEIHGNTIYKTEALLGKIKFEQGEIINFRQMDEYLRDIENTYKNEGYILARIADVDVQPDVHMVIKISEGILEGFAVKGNKKTKKNVILREMRLKPGKPFNAKDARRSVERLYNLGYFEDVNIKLNPGKTADGVEMEIDVIEQNTGQFMIGAGYSNTDGFVGIIGVGDKNFLGMGDRADLRWEFGGKDNRNYELSYFRPWLTKSELGVGISLYNATHEYQDYFDDGSDKARYDRKRKGIELSFSQPLSEYTKTYLTFKNRRDVYVKPIAGYVPQYYETHPGRLSEDFGLTRSVTLGVAYDNRDNIYDPTRGKRIGFSTEVAGFSGDFKFNKFFVESSWYKSLGGKGQVLALRFNGGYATGTMPVSQRFAVGGAETLRGYKDDYYRGYKMLLGTLEYRYPIVKRVQGVLFTDYGYAWDKGVSFNFGDMKLGYGLGLRIASPLGPVRLDYARGSQGGRFHFSFGGNF